MEQDNKLTVNLNVFDKDGYLLDSTTAELTLSQISNIIDQASQVIRLRRNGGYFENIMDDLDDALSAADVIEDLYGPGVIP